MILCIYNWYWQDVAQEIVKYVGLAEALPRFKFLKTVKSALSIDQIMHKHCFWRELDRGIAKCHLSSAEIMPRSKS